MTTVRHAVRYLPVGQCACRCDNGVHDALEHLVAVPVEDRVVGHQVADVADEHETAAGQNEAFTIGARVFAIGVQTPRQGLAAFREGRLEGSLHEAQPVAIDVDLVLGVDSGNRVFAILDRRDRRFQHDVRDIGGSFPADRVIRIRLYLDVQAVA